VLVVAEILKVKQQTVNSDMPDKINHHQSIIYLSKRNLPMVAGRRVWNTLSEDTTSAPSLTIFC